MTLSNNKKKYIINTLGQKSAKELSIELNASEAEIESIRNKYLHDNKNRIGHGLAVPSKVNGSHTIISGHICIIFVIAILIFIAPLVCLGTTYYDYNNLAQGLYIQTISGFMMFLWILDSFLNKNFEIKKSNLYLPIICILIWSGLSFIWATNTSESR